MLESDDIFSNNLGTTFVFNGFARFGLKLVGVLALVLADGEVCAKARVIEDVVATRRRTNSKETPKIDIDAFLFMEKTLAANI
jgi:hypothetical protein